MDKLEADLRTAAARIFEGAAFVFLGELAPGTEPEGVSGWDPIGVELSWSGPCSGTARLWVSAPLATLLASNLLGIDTSDPDSTKNQMDALSETLNMIVGAFLTEHYGTELVIHLGVPSLLLPEELDESLHLSHHFWIEAEGNPVLMSVLER